MAKIVTRAYNRFEMRGTNGVIRKVSATERLRDEISYYDTLNAEHPDQSVLFPRMIDYSSHIQHEYWMDLELYDYPNLGNYLFGNEIMPSWAVLFISLRKILTEWSSIHPRNNWSSDHIKQAAIAMYITKTELEFENFRNGWHDKFNNLFVDQVDSHELFINGTTYTMFEIIWPRVKQYIQDNMLNFTPSLMHGDCCFSNILYGHKNNIIRFIDPRGSFGKFGIYGDIRYDVAKLYHSLDGAYEAFITDKFKVTADKNSYQLDIMQSVELDWVLDEFEYYFFPQFNKKEIKIIQGCIFIGMCARHYDNMERQRAMYLTGTRLLNEALAL